VTGRRGYRERIAVVTVGSRGRSGVLYGRRAQRDRISAGIDTSGVGRGGNAFVGRGSREKYG
jgi:hypothetical protein